MEPKESVILLAEDDAVVRNLVALMLSKEGYAVLAANDGQEAFEICRQYKGQIHLLLTDVTMPRMTGMELAERVLKIRSEIKILVMSASTTTTTNRNRWRFWPILVRRYLDLLSPNAWRLLSRFGSETLGAILLPPSKGQPDYWTL
jgi:CheY-like chemotaxis protein